jgi:uncharacterized protein (DUF3084 family)
LGSQQRGASAGEAHAAELKQKEAQIAVRKSKVEELKTKHAYFEAMAARLEALGVADLEIDVGRTKLSLCCFKACLPGNGVIWS